MTAYTTKKPPALIAYALALCLLLLLPLSAFATEEARKLVAVVDYIGGDYQNAVRAGAVANPDEYREMVEFAARALDLAGQLRAAEKRDRAGVEASLNELASEIK